MLRIGIDLGGTKTELIALDPENQEVFRHRVQTPQGDYHHTVETIGQLVEFAEQTLGEQGCVGIGTPGSESRVTGRMKNCNSTCLNDQPLRADLQARLHRSIRIANDANCFALSEASDGAAAGQPVVFGVILGTGCGAGVVVHGHVLDGPNGIAGEWGHNPLPWPRDDERPGPPCYCGKHGCLETWLSGPGMAKQFDMQCGIDQAERTSPRLQAHEIVRLAETGDAAALNAMLRYEDRMARGLAHIINILDPDVIVLGGGLSRIERLYQNIPAQWGQYVFSDTVRTRLLPPRFGDSSGVRGAAWLWPLKAKVR